MTVADEGWETDIELLLPWYAAGTLSRREAQRVEAALAGNPELARRYELVRKELGQTILLNEALGAPSARAMDALFEKIDAQSARAPATSSNFGARVRGFFADLSPRTLAWSASAAAFAIVLQAAVIGAVVLKGSGQERIGSYATASMPMNGSGEGSYALIRFQPDANAADIDKFLKSNKLSLAGGPSAGGLYRVLVAAKKLPTADLVEIVKRLQTNKVVGFIAAAK